MQLHVAACNGYSRVVQFLLTQHAAVDAADDDHWRPLHCAACWSQVGLPHVICSRNPTEKAVPDSRLPSPKTPETHSQWRSHKEIMQGTMPGARVRGRPRTAWMGNIKTWTGLSVEESIRMTEDRDKWRKYVHGVANPRIEDG